LQLSPLELILGPKSIPEFAVVCCFSHEELQKPNDMKKAKVLNNFSALVFTHKAGLQESHAPESRGKVEEGGLTFGGTRLGSA